MSEMARLEREELRVLLLNAKNGVIRQSTVYVGNVSAALVRVAELFRDAVRAHAAGLIVVHAGYGAAFWTLAVFALLGLGLLLLAMPETETENPPSRARTAPAYQQARH